MHTARSIVLVFFVLVSCVRAYAEERDPPGIEPDARVLPAAVLRGERTLSLLEKRLLYERSLLNNPFAIIPHKPNYILPLTYNTSPNSAPFAGEQYDMDDLEMKFQLSFKIALWREIFTDDSYLFFAYTQQSYWQAYNTDNSSPFRETNHEPELILTFFTDYDVLGVSNRMIALGFVHQSNGQAGGRSRSWNRVYASLVFEKGNFYVNLKPWYRIPESEEDDDNPDIDEYIGHGELNAVYVLGKHRFGTLVRNNLRSHNRWGVQIDWSFPLSNRIKGYLQYYGGYGESLIDYNHSNNRFGLGVMLTDWL